jgi:uncharacterized protein YjbI with pentapeptide repeats
MTTMSTTTDTGKYKVRAIKSQGVVIGDGNTVHQTFPMSRPENLRPVAPPPPPQLFGRDELVDEITNLLLSDSCPPVIGLWGLPGVGIGVLLRYVVYQHTVDEKFLDGCLWIDVQQAQNEIVAVFRRLAINLGRDPNFLDDLPAIKDQVRAALSSKRTLVVFDNVNQHDVLVELTKLARVGETVLIITTHQRELAVEFAEQAVEVPPLSPNNAARLLRYHAQLSEEVDIKKLIARTAGLPTLICALGRKIRTKRPPQKEKEIQRLITELPAPGKQLELTAGTIPFREALLLNYNAATLPAQRILRLLGLLSSDHVAGSLISELTRLPSDQTADLIDELLDLYLLEAVADDTYRLLTPVHALASELALQGADLDDLIDQAIIYFTSWIDNLNNTAGFHDLSQYESSLTHYMALFEIVLSLEQLEGLHRLSNIQNRPVSLDGNFTAIQASPFPLAYIRATFNHSCLDNVDFRGALFEDLHISQASCHQVKAAAAIFSDIYADNSLFHDVDLQAIRAQDIHPSNSSLVLVDLRAAEVRDIHFDHCQATNIDLRNARLRDLHISNSRIAHIQLDGATFRNIHVSESILVDIDFTQAAFNSFIADQGSLLIQVHLPANDQAKQI